jgi:hypothetical protein
MEALPRTIMQGYGIAPHGITAHGRNNRTPKNMTEVLSNTNRSLKIDKEVCHEFF